MKFEIIKEREALPTDPDKSEQAFIDRAIFGKGDSMRIRDPEERPLVQIKDEFSTLKDADRWKRRRPHGKKRQPIPPPKKDLDLPEGSREDELPRQTHPHQMKAGREKKYSLVDWIAELEPIEQAYVRQAFRFWNGTNGGMAPAIPRGMSKARADILRYHCKSLNDGKVGQRKTEQGRPVSFRWTDKFFRQLAFESSELDINLSEYVHRCLNVGRPLVLAYPRLSKIFEDPCLRNTPMEETEDPRGEGRGK